MTDPGLHAPAIRTARLMLVPLLLEDGPEMVAVLADPDLYSFIGGTPPTLAELRARYDAWAKGSRVPGETWHNWIIRQGGTAIGHAQATQRGGRADIAWLIGTPWQRRGYAGEAARAVVGWLEAAGVTTITAHVHPDHVASARVAARAGLDATDEVEDGEVVWRRVRERTASAY